LSLFIDRDLSGDMFEPGKIHGRFEDRADGKIKMKKIILLISVQSILLMHLSPFIFIFAVLLYHTSK